MALTDYGTVAGIGSFLLALIVAVATTVGLFIRNDHYYLRIVDWLRLDSWRARHRRSVEKLLEWADSFYGKKLGGYRAFDRCLVIALLYPLVTFLIGWAFGGPSALVPGIEMGDDVPLLRRWLSLVLLAALGGGIVVYMRYFDRILDWIESRLRRLLARNFSGAIVNSRLAKFILSAFVFGAFVAGGLVGAVSVVVAGFAVIAGGVVVAGVAVGAVRGFVAVVVGGVVVAVVAGVAVGAVDMGVAAFYVAVFLILPVVNAALDYISLGISRALLCDIYKGGQEPAMSRIVWHLAVDIAAAFVFLLALVFILPAALQIINRVFDFAGWPFVAWDPLLAAAQDAPFSEGIMVTAMLATTLLPTAVHLVLGATGILVPNMGAGISAILAKGQETVWHDRAIVVVVMTGSILVSLVLFGAVIWGLWLLINGIEAHRIVDLVLWSARLVGGPGLPTP